jgi:RHS repeat-associated protein
MVAVNFLGNPLNDNVLREFDDAGVMVAEYATEPGEFGNVISQRRDGASSYFHFDGVGSTLSLTAQAGTVTDSRAYSAFGETKEASGSTGFSFQFVGVVQYQYDTELAACYVRRRTLSPSVGRWTSPDPLGPTAGASNIYLYAGNSPITLRWQTGNQLSVLQRQVHVFVVVEHMPSHLLLLGRRCRLQERGEGTMEGLREDLPATVR